MPVHIFQNHGAKAGIGKRIKIQFGPCAFIVSGANAATIGALEALQVIKRADHLLAKCRAEGILENLDIAAEGIGCHGGVQGKLSLLLFHFLLISS